MFRSLRIGNVEFRFPGSEKLGPSRNGRMKRNFPVIPGAIHSTKISGNFGPKLNGSVRSNRKSFEKTGPPFEVVLFSRSDRLEFWLNGSRPPIFRNFRPTSRGTPKISERNSGKCLFHSLHNPEFPEFLVEWKAPRESATSTTAPQKMWKYIRAARAVRFLVQIFDSVCHTTK